MCRPSVFIADLAGQIHPAPWFKVKSVRNPKAGNAIAAVLRRIDGQEVTTMSFIATRNNNASLIAQCGAVAAAFALVAVAFFSAL
jgi:hypothetical protein